jgi:7-cyano-7-deazaguanine synthase in queuosine biosynthesis
MKALGPTYRVSFGSGDGLADERFSGQHFRLDHRCLGDYFLTRPPQLLDDLLRISTSAYVIDRLVKRRRQGSGRSWPRHLRISIEVMEPDFWNSKQVYAALTDSLEFVSGDCWEIEFEKTSGGRPNEDSYLAYPDPFASEQPLVCLYSGGLDSATGMALRIKDCPKRPVIPVTVWHQPRQRTLIRQQFQKIKDRYGVCLSPVIVKAAMLWNSKVPQEEKSQRCRPFLFAAVGGVVAAMQNAASVDVFESGVGAINMPLMAGMVGSKATRSCHPEFLRLMSQLLTLVAGRDITYRLPFMDMTKGQMVKLLANEGLENLAHSTVSCVHYPLREKPHKQCGVCPACIFRSQAMRVGGIKEPNGTYKFDLFGLQQVVNRIPDRFLKYLKAFLMQVMQLAPLDADNELPRRIRRHLLGSRILGHGESAGPMVEVLRRYRQEWLTIASEGIERGWDWAKLLAPTESTKQEGPCHASA